jgi:hypothetical protein
MAAKSANLTFSVTERYSSEEEKEYRCTGHKVSVMSEG